ncbi:MAG: DUF3881 family protein [Vallitaleaceae bacterium]|jgi:hypothetical protein|nr:DUF3881 family protein [Vallitaleaceae bacterium]
MILYIQALGFDAYDNKEKAEILVNDIVKNPTRKYISNYKKDHIKVEYYKEFGDNFGLLVRGILNDKEELNVYSLLPHAIGSKITDTHEVDVLKVDKKDVYNGYCEEGKSGTPISFYLQNVIDYLDIEDKEEVYIKGIRLISYCIEGTVILPIDKEDEELLIEDEVDTFREELLEQARLGDEDALDMLEDEVMEASEILQERLKSEDILSILEGFFVPIDDTDDTYSILGEIYKVEKKQNTFTNESTYLLSLKCMNLYIDVYISEKEIVGIPTIGMRFKGTAWVHGLIEFEYEEHEKPQ